MRRPMWFFLVVLPLLSLGFPNELIATGRSQQDSSDGTSSFSSRDLSGTHEIRVFDLEGRPVSGLRKEDFRVVEEGRERPVVYFEEVEKAPLSLGILFDVGAHMSEKRILDLRQVVLELIHLLQAEDEILLGVFADGVYFLSELTTDRIVLSEAVFNIDPGGRAGLWERLGLLFTRPGNTGYAVDQALLRMTEARGLSKIVLVFSGGFGNLGDGTLDHLKLADARFFGVAVPNLLADVFSVGDDRAARRRIERGTGGITFSADEVGSRPELLRDSLKSLYLLAHHPAELEKDLSERDIRIELWDHPRREVRAALRGTRDSAFYGSRPPFEEGR